LIQIKIATAMKTRVLSAGFSLSNDKPRAVAANAVVSATGVMTAATCGGAASSCKTANAA
jgi:hypothetical protein